MVASLLDKYDAPLEEHTGKASLLDKEEAKESGKSLLDKYDVPLEKPVEVHGAKGDSVFLEGMSDAEFFPEFATGGSLNLQGEPKKVEEPKEVIEGTPGWDYTDTLPESMQPRIEVYDTFFPEVAGGSAFNYREAEYVNPDAIEGSPIIDPTMIISTAGAVSAKLSYGAFRRAGVPIFQSLIRSVGRGGTAGTIAGLTEFGIAVPTSYFENVSPATGLVLNIAMGMTMGLTFERALEKTLMSNLPEATPKIVAEARDEAMKILATGDNMDILNDIQRGLVDGGITVKQLGDILDGKITAEDVNKAIGVTEPVVGEAEKSAKAFGKRVHTAGDINERLGVGETAERIIAGKAEGSAKAIEGQIKVADEILEDAVRNIAKGEVTKSRLERMAKKPAVEDAAGDTIYGAIGKEANVNKQGDWLDDAAEKAWDEARRIFRDTDTLRSGVPPDLLKHLTVVGAWRLRKGGRDFAKWSEAMMKDFGPLIEPYLKEVYDASENTIAKGIIRATRQLETTKMQTPEEMLQRYGATNEEVDRMQKYSGSINMERIEAEEDVLDLIRKVTDDNSDIIREARRGVITHDQTLAMAKRTGMTEQALIKAMKHKAGTVLNAEQQLALSMVNVSSANNVMKLQKIAQETGTQEDMLNFMLALEKHRIIQKAESGVATEAGRALNARKILKTPEQIRAKNLDRMLDAVGGRELAEETIQRLRGIDLTDYTAMNKFIHDLEYAPTIDKIYEAWINSLLSSPTTHAVNTMSNTLTFLSKFPEKQLAVLYDVARSTLKGAERTRYIGEVGAEMFGAVQGQKTAWANFKWSWVNEMSTEGVDKLETGASKAIKGKTGKVIRLPGRFLVAADEYFKALNYTSELYGMAYRQGKVEKLEGMTMARRINEIVTNPGEEMVKNAKAEARYRTFQKELGPTMKKVQALRDSFYPLKLMLPFLRTPTNIALFALERTPFAFAHIMARNNDTAIKLADSIFGKTIEKMDPGEKADRVGRALWGTIMGGTAYMAASEGAITGAGPTDRTEREALYRTGWKPYSIKYGDRYIPFGRLEPLGSILGMAADMYEGREMMTGEEKEKFALLVARSFATNLASKTFLKGATDFFQFWGDPERYGDDWMSGFARTIVPRLLATGARATDPVLRERSGVLDTIKSDIPGWAQTLYPKRDIWGNAIERAGAGPTRFISPIVPSKVKGSEADHEIARLQANISRPRKHVGGIKLTPRQYDTMLFYGGNLAEKRINAYLKSAPDNDDFRRQSIEKLYYNAIDMARKTLFQKNREGREAKSLTEKPLYKQVRKQIDKEEKF